MEATFTVSVGEEGKDFITLPIVTSEHNPNIWDVYASNRSYYDPSDRQPAPLYVDGRGVFPDKLPLYVRSIAYYEEKPRAMLLIGQIHNQIVDRFYEVVVFYLVHDAILQRSGYLRVYLSDEDKKLFGTPEEIKSLFGDIDVIPMS